MHHELHVAQRGKVGAHDFSNSLNKFGDRLKQIGDQPIVGNLKDRRLRILVDGDDHLAVFHSRQVLDRAGNSDRDIEVRRDDLAGLPDLVVVGHEAGIHRGAGGADRGIQLVRKLLQDPEVVAAAHAAASGNDCSRRCQLRTVGFGDLLALESGEAAVGRSADRFDCSPCRRLLGRRRSRWLRTVMTFTASVDRTVASTLPA